MVALLTGWVLQIAGLSLQDSAAKRHIALQWTVAVSLIAMFAFT